MTLLQKLSLAATLSSATFSVASNIPKTILPDNIIRCEPNTGCVSKTLNGRSYKVLDTARFTVMVAISHQGIYTRADVSITNKTDMPLPMSPEDFRVEVVTPKPKILLYVAPAATASQPPASPAGSAFLSQPSPAASEIDPISAAAKEKTSQEAAEKTAAEHDLSATSIPLNEAASGRVYFERDKRAHLINVVLPIAGQVFEFPYAMKK